MEATSPDAEDLVPFRSASASCSDASAAEGCGGPLRGCLAALPSYSGAHPPAFHTLPSLEGRAPARIAAAGVQIELKALFCQLAGGVDKDKPQK